ncbi:MAG TPA: VWA domain-containing protein [Gemmatimonadales bacterium]|nr:VWA domain-containing protein [Gemmatimonadales bacterium]
MSFLAPLWLLLGAAAAVPLVLHLMRRQVGARIEFPAARYLRRAEREFSARMKLRNLLLMLLRVLAIVLVALAAARPATRLVAGGHPPTGLAIVLDNSMSTGAVVEGGTVFESLVKQADGVLESASQDDRLWIITADGEVRSGSRNDLRAVLADLRPMAGAGSLPDAVDRAAALTSVAGLAARHVLVLTDGQSSALTRSADVSRGALTVFVAPSEPPRNRAVLEAEASPGRWTPRGAVTARMATEDSTTWRIALEGRTLARGIAQPGEELLVRVAPSERGWLAGQVELEPDELRADDARHFAVWIGSPPGVTVSADAGSFVASAVDALVQSERADVGNDVLIASADRAGRLPALLIAPSEAGRVSAANRTLASLGIPWRLGPARSGREALVGDRADGASVTSRYQLRPEPGARADTLLTAGGDAWAVAGEGYILVASPLAMEATDFPLRAGFVPWIGDLLSQRLGAARGTLIQSSPATRVTLPPEVNALELPDGNRRTVAGELATPAESGVYFLLRGTERVGALVVNPESRESVLDRLTTDEIRSRFSARDLVVSSDPATISARAWTADAGRSITGPLLVLALGLLIAESAVARGTRAQKAG